MIYKNLEESKEKKFLPSNYKSCMIYKNLEEFKKKKFFPLLQKKMIATEITN